MKKVLVLGCSGAGKSTFAFWLGQATGLPVIHLDSIYWKSGWVASTNDEWDEIMNELVKLDSYIMDGNYSRTLDKRLVQADTVFYFDFPRRLCIYRVIKRRIINHRKTRADMAKGCSEKIDLEFLNWVWNYRKRNRGRILEMLEKADGQKQVHIFRNPGEVKKYIESNR